MSAITLMQADELNEYFTSIFQSPEERELYNYISSLEFAAPGCTIFMHKYSEDGYYLCTVPAAWHRYVELGLCPPRLCGCLECAEARRHRCEDIVWANAEVIRQFQWRLYGDYCAWSTAPESVFDENFYAERAMDFIELPEEYFDVLGR